MFVCEFCKKEIKNKRNFKKHIEKFHPEKVTYNIRCPVCNKGFDELSFELSHITKCHKDFDIESYYNDLKIRCKFCNEILSYKNKFKYGDFCNQQHYESYKRKDKIKYVCQICKSGFEDKGGLQQHLGKMHKEVNQEEYYRKYLMKSDEPDGKCLWCGKEVSFSSFTDGYNRFCYNSDCNVRWYNHNSNRKEIAAKSLSQTYKKDKSLLPQNIEYWIKKGFNEEEAKQKVKERQTTFTKEKCIEKYGIVGGLKRWQERQEKWQFNLKSKSIDEQERINKAKMGVKSYSKVSQLLFWKIDKSLSNKYKIYFAEKDNGKHLENNEYMIFTKNKRVRFLDFYIPEINKCIEFDGDYWHNIDTVGNVERDRIREEEIKSSIQGIQILHVKEKDYKKNPEKVLQECLEFING